MNKNKTDILVQALSTTAEMSLVFYRAALGAGAAPEEAIRLTQAYIGALLFGKGRGAEQEQSAPANEKQFQR